MYNLNILNILYATGFVVSTLILGKTLAAPVAVVLVDKARLQSLAVLAAFTLR